MPSLRVVATYFSQAARVESRSSMTLMPPKRTKGALLATVMPLMLTVMAVSLNTGSKVKKNGAGRCLRRCLGGLHHGEGVDAVSAVDVGDFAGDAGGEVGEQEGGGIAHFFDGYVAAEGVLVGDVFEQFA